jgi:hypothetical protein
MNGSKLKKMRERARGWTLTKASLELLVGQSKGLLDVGQRDMVRGRDDTLSNLTGFTDVDQQHILNNNHAMGTPNDAHALVFVLA